MSKIKITKSGDASLKWNGQTIEIAIPFSLGHNNYLGAGATTLCDSIVSYYQQYSNYIAGGVNKGLIYELQVTCH
jgi:hypothetical protein